MMDGEINKESHTFERLYKKGKVYVFPELVPPEHRARAVNEEGTSKSAPLLSHSDDPAVDEVPYVVKDLLRYTLQGSTGENDLPSFLLYNTRLSRKENVILIFSRKLGVAVMIVRSDNDLKHVNSLEKAVTHLLEAKGEVRKKVRGLVKSRAITAAIAFPNLPDTKVTDLRDCIKILRSHPDVEALIGQDQATFMKWAGRLSRRPDSEVWDLKTSGGDSPDTTFEMAASRFLTLAGSYHPGKSPQHSTAAESWLLTPDQMKVRDSTARLLHVWGSPGSGKTTLLIHRARQWLEDRKAVVLIVGREVYYVLLAHVVKEVLRQQNKETRMKIRVCRMHSKLESTVKELRGQYPETEICLVIDALEDSLLFQNILQAVRSQQVSAVWSVCRDSLQTIDPVLAKETQSLGWESFKLPDSIRCTKDIVDLLNQLRQESATYYPITSCIIPRTRDTPTWRVVDHCRHLMYMSITSDCGHCKRELSTALSLPDRIPHWREWIALFTGNPNEHIDIRPVCKTLMNHGVPASLDSYYEIVASHGSHPDSSDTDVANWLERVVAGEDEGGKATVHLVRARDLAGMEKEGVLLVHWDERDNDPNCQSVGDRNARLEEHRHLWFLAVSRCKSQVILLLLTPSPARSLLNLPEAVMPVT